MTDHSFAVVAYQDSPYLADCLTSLKEQTVKSRLYIATSTPSDYIRKVAEQFGLEVFVTKAEQGIAHDWNFGLQLAKTKYVTLAHQDDLYMPEYTATSLHHAEKFRDTLICFTGYSEIVNGKERSNTLMLHIKRFILWIGMPFRKYVRSKFCKKALLSVGCPIPAPCVMYNLELLKGFQFNPRFTTNLDWEAWYRMAGMNGRFVFADKPLLKHRIHADSATTEGLKTSFRQREDLEMFSHFWLKPIARVLAKLYAGSYTSNRANPR